MLKQRAAALAVVAAIIAVAATGASAARFDATPGGSVTGSSVDGFTFIASGVEIDCDVTLGGSMSGATLAKTVGLKVGEVSSMRWSGCSGGEVEAVLGLPWEVDYTSFTGTLPSAVTAMNVTVVNAQIRLRVFGGLATCLYAGALEVVLTPLLLWDGSYTTWPQFEIEEEGSELAKRSGGELCPATATAEGWIGTELGASQSVRLI